jgi:type IV secretion system protein VirD4
MSRFASAPWPLRAAYVGALAVLAAGLLGAVALAIALAGLNRLSGGLDLSAAPAWFWYFRGDPLVRRWLGAGMAGALGLAGFTAIAILRGARPPLHGAARWARESDLVRGGLRARQGIVLGRKGGRLLVFGGDEHLLLYAPTRTGKGVGIVIPSLLTWPDSTVVLDVKRENWDATAGFRAAHGQAVFLFDPLDPEGRTARFNPLGHVDRQDPVAVVDELQKLAVILFPAPMNADPFWAEAARTGFIGVGALIAETPERTLSLGEIYLELTEGNPRTRLPAIIAARDDEGRPLSRGCVAALADFCSTSDNTFSSVKQTLTARMGLWLNPRVRWATDASDFDLRDLRSRRMSLYLGVTPDNLARVAPLYNLVLQQLLDLNTRERPMAARHPVQALIVLDEFARLGHAAMVAAAFAYVAGYGLRLLAVLQSPAQLRAQYGPDLAEEIMANCGVEVAFAPKELKIAQDLSERLGYWTYRGRAENRPSLLSRGQWSQTESDQRRALMMPQELMRLEPDRLIVLRPGLSPVLGRKLVYWRDRRFQSRVSPPPSVAPHPTLASRTPVAGGQDDRRDAQTGSPTERQGVTSPGIEGGARADLEPMPPIGADAAAVEAWVERFIDASVLPATEDLHAR